MLADPRNHDLWLLNCVFNLMRGERPYVLQPPASLISPSVEFYGRIERSAATDVLDHMVRGLHPHSESHGTIAIGPYHASTKDFSRRVIVAMGLYRNCALTIEEETAELKDSMADAMGAQSFQNLEDALKRDEILKRLHPYLDKMYAWVDEKIADAQHELKTYGSGNKNKREGYEGDLRVWPRMEDAMRYLEPVVVEAIYKGVLDEEAIDHALIIADSQLLILRKEINDWWPLATALQIGLVESTLEAGIKKDAPANRKAMDLLHDTAVSWHLYLEQSHVDYWPVNTSAAQQALQLPARSETADCHFLELALGLSDAAKTYQAAKTFQFPDKPASALLNLNRVKGLEKSVFVM